MSLSEKGYVAVPLVLGWGKTGKVLEFTADNFKKEVFTIFGYNYLTYELKPIRELFLNAKTLYISFE